MAAISQTHKFTVQCTAILNNNEEINLDNSVDSIAIKKDFLSNVFPLYVLSLRLPDNDRLKLIKNNFYISLKIFRSTVTDFEIETDVDNVSLPNTDKTIVSILLRPFDNAKLYQHRKESDVDEEEASNAMGGQYVTYTINCIPKEQLTINNSILNYCYSNVNLSEVMINLISDVYNKDIYFQESINNNRYKSILIPQGSLVQSLRFLQDNYILYKHGLNIFFEYNKLYIYDIHDLDREFNNTLSISIEENSSNTDQTKYSRNFIDEKDNIQKFLDNNPIFLSRKDVSNYMLGDRLIVNSYDDNFNLITRTYDNSSNEPDDKKTRVLWNIENQDIFETNFRTVINEISQLTFNNFDPSLIEPDTLITMSGSSLNYINGRYVLSGMDIYFSSSDKITFANSVVCHLIKKE